MFFKKHQTKQDFFLQSFMHAYTKTHTHTHRGSHWNTGKSRVRQAFLIPKIMISVSCGRKPTTKQDKIHHLTCITLHWLLFTLVYLQRSAYSYYNIYSRQQLRGQAESPVVNHANSPHAYYVATKSTEECAFGISIHSPNTAAKFLCILYKIPHKPGALISTLYTYIYMYLYLYRNIHIPPMKNYFPHFWKQGEGWLFWKEQNHHESIGVSDTNT